MHINDKKLGTQLLNCVKSNNLDEFKRLISNHKFNPVIDTFDPIKFNNAEGISLYTNNISTIIFHCKNKDLLKFLLDYSFENDIDLRTDISSVSVSKFGPFDDGYSLMGMVLRQFSDELGIIELMSSKQPEACYVETENNTNPLLFSVINQHFEAFKVMLKYVDKENISIDVLSSAASTNNDYLFLSELHNIGVNFNHPELKLVHECAESGNLAGIEFLDSIGMDFNTKDEYGNSVIKLATIYGHENIVSYLKSREVLKDSIQELDGITNSVNTSKRQRF